MRWRGPARGGAQNPLSRCFKNTPEHLEFQLGVNRVILHTPIVNHITPRQRRRRPVGIPGFQRRGYCQLHLVPIGNCAVGIVESQPCRLLKILRLEANPPAIDRTGKSAVVILAAAASFP